MATIAGVDCADGAILAGDRQVVSGGTVTGERRHVFDLDGVGAAAVGGDVDEFRRRLDAEVREYRTDRGEPTLEALARIAARVAEGAGVEALVAARDEDGRAGLRAIADGGVLDDDVAAFGSGAQVVIGSVEGAGSEPLDEAESRLRGAFSAAAERDSGTGEEVDVLRLEDASTADGTA